MRIISFAARSIEPTNAKELSAENNERTRIEHYTIPMRLPVSNVPRPKSGRSVFRAIVAQPTFLSEVFLGSKVLQIYMHAE